MKIRNAFTMLELIFVIVILGIVGKFGFEFLAQAYRNFIFTSVNNSLQTKSASAVKFIATRLQHRIKDSIIARNGTGGTVFALANANNPNFTVLEWIGTDIDGIRGNSAAAPALPNWSGVIDIDAGTNQLLVSPGTDTGAVSTLIDNLSNTNSDINDSAIYFVGSSSDIQNGYGWNGAITDQNQTMHPIASGTNANEFVSSIAGQPNFSEVYEYYKLAWTAYAIELTNDGNLTFHYDYQPWNGERLGDGNATQTLLMENVDTFQFMAVGSTIKIQVCVNSPIIDGDANGGYSLCKEKTIY